MDSKQKRKVLAAKAKPEFNKTVLAKKTLGKKQGKNAEKQHMPEMVAGREVLGRKLSVIKTTKKEAIWVKGAVKEFDGPTIRHKIKYDLPLPEVVNEGEEWLCLSKAGFMWKEDDFVCPFANPTYSSKYTPKREEAIGQRVKVFWSAMSKWYQGKVVDFDKVTGKHRVSFRDGEQNQYDLQQEALVWLDIPQLSSDAALKRMRSEEGDPVAVIRNDENQAPVESKSKDGSLAKVAQNGAQNQNGVKQAKPKKKPAKAEEDLKQPIKQDVPKAKPAAKQCKTPKEKPVKKGSAPSTPTGKAAANAAASKGTPGKKAAVDKAAVAPAVVQRPESVSEQKASPKAASPKAAPQGAKISVMANANGKSPVKGGVKSPAKAQAKRPQEEPSRKRSRLGDPALAVAASTQPEAKRRAVSKPASLSTKPARKQKASEESRLGAKRQKKEADVQFEEACQAVLGSRVGVWWEDDHCYYKGKIVAHDWFRKKLKISYDDGVEEYIQPLKEDTRFLWLTPRALTAGASDAVHAAFQHLRASNAGLPVATKTPASEKDASDSPPENGKQQEAPAATSPAADGTHLDALVPMQSNGSTGGKDEGQAKLLDPALMSGLPFLDSATRAILASGKTPSVLSAAMNNAQLNGIPASTAGLFLTGLQSMLTPGLSRPLSLPLPINGNGVLSMPLQQQLLQAKAGLPPTVQPAPASAAPRPSSAVSRSSSLPEAVQPESTASTAQGAAAEGWKVSIKFRGDGKQYHGRVLAFDPKTDRHLVLWEDGEDEWLDISKEQLTWHTDRGKTSGFSTGLPPGEEEPEGEKLKGWCLAVFWKHECKFFDGTVVDYDDDLDQHTIHYNDGEERCESVHNLIFKYVLPPSVQPVGGRRGSQPRRWQDSSDGEEAPANGYRRQCRRLRAASHEADTDEEWTGGKGEKRLGKAASATAPAPRNLSLTNRQQSLMQLHASSPSLHTPGSSEIRRLSSKCGSLLFFEGEDNPAVSPATSPKFSPQISPAAKQGTASNESKAQSAVDRRVTGLKSAMGFKTGVKRVRLYLEGWRPAAEKGEVPEPKEEESPAIPEPKPAIKQEPAELPDCPPDRSLVKLMLERVEAASLSMQYGTPVAMSPSTCTSTESGKLPGSSGWLAKQTSLPTRTIVSTKSAIDDSQVPVGSKEETGRSQSVPPSGVQQEHRPATPPPSPFASCFQGSDNSNEGAHGRDNLHVDIPDGGLLGSRSRSSVSRILEQLKGATGDSNGSPSHSPETPSAAGESQIVALSRNGSAMSNPLLAELLHCKLLSCKGQASLEEQLSLFQSK